MVFFCERFPVATGTASASGTATGTATGTAASGNGSATASLLRLVIRGRIRQQVVSKETSHACSPHKMSEWVSYFRFRKKNEMQFTFV